MIDHLRQGWIIGDHDATPILAAVCNANAKVTSTQQLVHFVPIEALAASWREISRMANAPVPVVAAPRSGPRGEIVQNLDEVEEIIPRPAACVAATKRPSEFAGETASQALLDLTGRRLYRVTDAVRTIHTERFAPEPASLVESLDENDETFDDGWKV